ncbi:MAG: hypothetical protein AAF959_23030 [Cyanobacteria bacterium P01_D01_bin.56]
MNSTDPRMIADIESHTSARYTAQQIAQAHNVGESTVRTRWFEWLLKVAPAELLKDRAGYTELARTLFEEFADVRHCDRNQWVTDTKIRYAPEWSNAGVIEGELMPDSVSSALALRQTQNGMMQQSITQELADLEAFVDQLAVTEADFSDAELASFQAAGQRRGMMRYKLELQAEMDTYGHLKQRRMQGG